MHGGELFDRVVDAPDGRMREPDARGLLYHLTAAVAYMHSKGYAHRDLKPENVLLDAAAVSTMKLADFGISARVPAALRDGSSLGCRDGNAVERAMPFHRICGSPEYMAPEVICANRRKGRGYGIKCDVWSLGVIMYVLLCGEPPFSLSDSSDEGSEDSDEDGDHQHDHHIDHSKTIGGINVSPQLQKLFHLICQGKMAPMRGEHWAGVSSEAKRLIKRMLEPDPLKRPSARQVMCDAWFRRGAGMSPSDNEEEGEEDEEDEEEDEEISGGKNTSHRKSSFSQAKARSTQSNNKAKQTTESSDSSLKDSAAALASPFLRQSKSASTTSLVLDDLDAKAIQPTTEKKRLLFLARREFLLSIGRELSVARELGDILADGVHSAAKLTHADRGSFFLVDSERHVMWTTVAEGMGSTRIVIPWSKGFAGACRVSKQPVITRNVDQDKRRNVSKTVDHQSGYHTKSMLCVPVVHEDGTVMAVVQMINKLGPDGTTTPRGRSNAQNYAFDDEDLHLLEDFAVHLSLALSRLNTLGKHNDEGGHASFSLPEAEEEEGEEEEENDDKGTLGKRMQSNVSSRSAVKRRKKASDEEEEVEAGSAGSGCAVM